MGLKIEPVFPKENYWSVETPYLATLAIESLTHSILLTPSNMVVGLWVGL